VCIELLIALSLSSSSNSDKVMSSKVRQITFARRGALTVVSGWDIGVAGMQIGGEREIVVPPSMGYGNRKMGDIPPGSTLMFGASQLNHGPSDKMTDTVGLLLEVKLLEIK